MSETPTVYERQANFTSYEASNPASPKPGASLDAEFNAVKTSIDETQDRLAEIQREDGALVNGIVTLDSLAASVTALLTLEVDPRGAWVTSTSYLENDLVTTNSKLYLCLEDHVSSVFATDLSNAKWQLIGVSAPTATDVDFTPAAGVAAVTVQAAIEEVAGDHTTHTGLASGAHAASAISSTPAGSLSATNVQDALNELDTEKAPLASPALTGVPTVPTAAASTNTTQAASTAFVQQEINGHTGDAAGAHAASAISFTPVGSIAASDVQAAIAELLSELIFTKSFTSSNQTITAAGALTLAHSMGVMPSLVQVRLKCTTGEHGYSIGDEVIWNSGDQNANRGCSIVPDATNLNIRYGSGANTFNVNHKTTGASSAITNASWVAIFKAWA